MKSLLVLGRGDTEYSDRNRARLVWRAGFAKFDVKEADYHEVGALGGFKTKVVNVMPFFPFTFWNANCEVPKDTELYGTSRAAYEMFRDFFLDTKARLERRLEGHELHYVIPPESAPIDRDKVETIRRLRERDVPTSVPVVYTSLQDILDQIEPGRGIFIKCRYGAEGKGITVLHDGEWRTNYQVDGDRLTNYGVYGKWPFTDITGRRELLEQLLEHEVIVEKEILTPQLHLWGVPGGASLPYAPKFDLRAYVIGRTVPHLFVRLNDPEKVVTNYSQGGTVKHHPNTGLDEDCIRLVRSVAIRAAMAMRLEFVGVDMMFDGSLANPRVVEAQAFTDFPDIRKFDLATYMISGGSGLFL